MKIGYNDSRGYKVLYINIGYNRTKLPQTVTNDYSYIEDCKPAMLNFTVMCECAQAIDSKEIAGAAPLSLYKLVCR